MFENIPRFASRAGAMLLLELLFVLLIATNAEGSSILDWVLGSSEPISKEVVGNSPLKAIPFEVSADDELFLQEAAKYTSLKLSDLDACQHRVVMQIHSSCSSMGDEELAKMSVQLLNCQSRVEGRPEFPCTKAMSLRECTTPMDADTWNTYHLMSNRARAVCYASRHQQFRALSEMTVNKLMGSAHDQLAAMAILKEGQHKLESMTSHTLETVAEGHKTLAAQQERLKDTQRGMQQYVARNLGQLVREKALIAAGHAHLARLTADIRQRIEAASSQLAMQSEERQENHKQLVENLDAIQRQAQEIWRQIESSTSMLVAQHLEAAANFEQTLAKLSRINAIVEFVLGLVEQTQKELILRLEWIGSFVGGARERRMDRLQGCMLHATYLVLGMVAAAFLQAPRITRLSLLVVVLGNLWICMSHGPASALDFGAMTILIVAVTAASWLYHLCWLLVSLLKHCSRVMLGGVVGVWTRAKQVARHAFIRVTWMLRKCSEKLGFKAQPIVNVLPAESEQNPAISKLDSWLDAQAATAGYTNHSNGGDPGSNQSDAGRNSSSDQLGGGVARSVPLQGFAETQTSVGSRSETPYSQASASRQQCAGTCRTGQRCRNSAVPGTYFCRHHVPAC